MTDYLPEGIRAAGRIALFAAPTVANLSAPKLTEFSAASAFFFHCDVYGWAPKGTQDKTEENRYCLAQTVQSFGATKWEIEDLSVVYDPQTPESPNYRAYKSFLEGTSWVIADRRNIPYGTALAVGQVADLYQVKVGVVSHTPLGGDAGETFKATIPLIITGVPKLDAVFIA